MLYVTSVTIYGQNQLPAEIRRHDCVTMQCMDPTYTVTCIMYIRVFTMKLVHTSSGQVHWFTTNMYMYILPLPLSLFVCGGGGEAGMPRQNIVHISQYI